MELFDAVLEKKCSSLSIIGLAKNTGKTTTLNHLLQWANLRETSIALTTIGLDGEERDTVFQHPKPRIFVRENTIVANAHSLLLACGLDCEVLQLTGIPTPLGEVVIARVKEQGLMTLGGPSSIPALQRVVKEMESYADLVLVDGALDRRSLSAPTVSCACVLAVGGALGERMDTIVTRASFSVELFHLQETTRFYQEEIAKHPKARIVFLQENQATREVALLTALGNMNQILEEAKEAQALFIRGPVVDSMLEELSRSPYSLELIVHDASCLFLTPMVFRRFLQKGGRIRVQKKIELLGVTVNPFCSDGNYIEPLKLLCVLGELIYPVPCYEVVLGKKYTRAGICGI